MAFKKTTAAPIAENEALRSRVGRIVWDNEFNVKDWNPAAEVIFGYSREEILGRSPLEMIVPEDARPFVSEVIRNLLNGEEASYSASGNNIRKDGEIISCQWFNSPLTDSTGNPDGALSMVIDITDRERAEAELQATQDELQETRRLLQTVFDSIPHAVFVRDLKSRYLLVNKEMARRNGVSPEDFVGKHFLEAVPETKTDRNILLESDRRVFATGETLVLEPRAFVFASGKEHLVRTTKTPLVDETGVVVGLLGISEDITDRTRLESQLQQAQKMESIGILAGGVAHDFNNMLQIIHGYGIRAQTRTGDDLVKEDIQKILTASESAAALTKQLLTFSQKQSFETTNVAVDSLIGNLMRMMSRILGDDIELKVVPGLGDRAIYGDAGRVEQVLMNLCVNARDAMPNGGLLVVQSNVFKADETFCSINNWARPGDYAVIEVRDAGVGMSGDQLDHIFEPFFTTKEVGKGTGLGLSVVFGIIEQHQGHIDVYSEPGVGSTFKVYLPLSDNGQPAPEDADPESAIGGRETILVAEDQPEVLELAVSILEDAGYTVLTAGDGEAACRTFEENSSVIDLVLLDVVMPKMSGTEAYENMRKITPSLRSLFSTGYSFPALDSGRVVDQKLEQIQKPYSPTVLLSAIRDVLEAV